MDGLADILRDKDFDMPPEIQAIKAYVKRHYDADVSVTLAERTITISGRSASLVSNLRLSGRELQKAAGTDRKLVFRIGK
ncbi:hypothetical protein KDA14_03880 [Candidatus Saccharibacteria bacterium]|nr:hypothetical protein [Candidatus Saccharibacteria bacterium]